MTLYQRLRRYIIRGMYERAYMLRMLDCFLLHKRITQDEYEELMELLDQYKPEENKPEKKKN